MAFNGSLLFKFAVEFFSRDHSWWKGYTGTLAVIRRFISCIRFKQRLSLTTSKLVRDLSDIATSNICRLNSSNWSSKTREPVKASYNNPVYKFWATWFPMLPVSLIRSKREALKILQFKTIMLLKSENHWATVTFSPIDCCVAKFSSADNNSCADFYLYIFYE